MINPSATGWIDKFFSEQAGLRAQSEDASQYYTRLRATGFLYGHIIGFDIPNVIDTSQWLHDEISKVALLTALYRMFRLNGKSSDANEFINSAVAFYDSLNPHSFRFLKKVLPGQAPSHTLEKIIDERVQTNDNIISKNFSHIVTNALLFADVLAFRQFLIHGETPEKYLKKLEEMIISLVTLALKTKTDKSAHDDLLVKLFEASLRYTKFQKVSINKIEMLPLDYFKSDLERYYLIDMAGLSLWSDGIIQKEEAYFLHTLASIIGVPEDFTQKSICDTNDFITRHKHNIPYFNYSNPVRHFYDQTTQLVITLIRRNKKRLAKEISESRELMVLLAHSTTRDLDKAEKKRVKKQLLDICKSIPSLTIFLIPGGSLLLPILVKFIPQLLPSAFNENLEEE